MGYAVDNLRLNKNVVRPGEQINLSLTVITWDYLNKNYTWSSLNKSKTWGDIVERK